MDVRKVLSIAGSDCSGGAGIQADIKAISAHNMYAMSAITALTAQNTTGVSAVYQVSGEFVGEQIKMVYTDIVPDSVKIGMVFNSDIIEHIAKSLNEFSAKNIVLDTVMVATSGAKLLEDSAIEALINRLIPISNIITPNIMEAEVLVKFEIKNRDDMQRAGKMLYKLYGTNVLIKGGHGVNDASDYLCGRGIDRWYNAPRIENPNTHGTGCTLSSAIACNLAAGYDIEKSVENSKDYIIKTLKANLNLGNGSGPLWHF